MSLPSDLAGLTTHIETRFHAAHRQQLPHLIALARRVEAAHGSVPEAPLGLADLLVQLSHRMDASMAREERDLFPAIREGRDRAGIEPTLRASEALLRQQARDLDRICDLTRDLTLPGAACGNWARLYADLGLFVAELAEHMRLERDVLFPACDLAVPPRPDRGGIACHG